MVGAELCKNKLLKTQFLFRHHLLWLPFGITFNMCFLSQIEKVIIPLQLPRKCYTYKTYGNVSRVAETINVGWQWSCMPANETFNSG